MATSSKNALANTPSPAPNETEEDKYCGWPGLLHGSLLRNSFSFSPFLYTVSVFGWTELKVKTMCDQIFSGTATSLTQNLLFSCMRKIKKSLRFWYTTNLPKDLKNTCFWSSALLKYFNRNATVKPWSRQFILVICFVAQEFPSLSKSCTSPLTPSVSRPPAICTPPLTTPQVCVMTSSIFPTDSRGQKCEQPL